MDDDYLPPGAPPRTTDVPRRVADENTRAVVKAAVWLGIAIALTLLLMFGAFRLTSAFVHRDVEQRPRIARGAQIRIPPPPRLVGAMGEQYRPEDFTKDPAIQEELRRDGVLDFELDRPERLGELYRSVKRQELETYGAAGPGVYRVPIERAKQLLLARPEPLAPVQHGASPVQPGDVPPAAAPQPALPIPHPARPDGRKRPDDLPRPSLELIQYSGPEYGPMRSREANETGLPSALEDVGLAQKLGARLPPELVLQDERGQPWRLGEALGHRPLVLVFAYYRCPMLCLRVLPSIAASLQALPLEAARDYEVIVVSFDPREYGHPELAAMRKKEIVGDGAAARGWHFLTAERSAIDHLTRLAGFTFRWDAASSQFAHAAGLIVVTPGGILSRYLYGVSFPPRDLRLALVEASGGRISSPVDDLLLYCFRYDPASGRYTAVVMNVLRLVAIALLVVGALSAYWWSRRARASGARDDYGARMFDA